MKIKMKIHREGYRMLWLVGLALLLVNGIILILWAEGLTKTGIASCIIFFLILQFFRNPDREIVTRDNNIVLAPADGKIVAIEETHEDEYFQDKRLQVSIFMSATNVHVNRNPVSGTVKYLRYHKGKYLVAWHPKSSTENERTTVVISTDGAEIMLRQIAGALAKRIVYYLQEGQEVEQGHELGFIKFGSRVDLFLPLDAKLEVTLGQKVRANQTIIARLNEEEAESLL